jgi:hypothetical protein
MKGKMRESTPCEENQIKRSADGFRAIAGFFIRGTAMPSVGNLLRRSFAKKTLTALPLSHG